jgi:hypothetical protein
MVVMLTYAAGTVPDRRRRIGAVLDADRARRKAALTH